MMNEKLTLSVEEAGKMLGVSRPVAYELVKREDFPAIRLGRRIVVSREGLRLWVLKEAGTAAEA